MINVDVSVKKHNICEYVVIIFGIFATCSCKSVKYLANIMDISVITCDGIIESYDDETKNFPTNFNEKKATCEMKTL